MRRRSRWGVVALWLCVQTVEAQEAAEELATATLEAEPGPCEPLALAPRVDGLLGRDAIVESGGDLQVRWGITRDGEAWTARFRLTRADGTVLGARVLEAPGGGCEPVLDTLATVLAIAIDVPRGEIVLHAGVLAEPHAASQEPAPTPRASPVEATEPPSSREPPRRHRRIAGALWLGASAAVGGVPAVAVGPRVGVEVAPVRWARLSASGTWWLEREVRSSGERARIESWSAELLACWRAHAAGWLAVDTCLGAFVGRATSEGLSFDEGRRARGTLFGVDGALRADLRGRRPVGLRVELGLRVPVRGPRIVYRDAGGTTRLLADAAPVGGILALSLLVEIGP